MLPEAPVTTPGLGDLAGAYSVVLCDVWGVLHDGVASFPAAVDALRRFTSAGGVTVLISNSPRPSDDVVEQLRSLGVEDSVWSAFVTSGDVTRTLLAAHRGRRAWAIGPDRDNVIYEGLDLRFAGPDRADFVSCTGLVNDERETPEDYREGLTQAASRGLEMICANPDRRVQRGSRLIPCAGALADLYAELGGRVVMAGKPYAPIYEAALAAAGSALGAPPNRSRVLAIGDGIATDVKGAAEAGLDCVFIVSGIHAADAADEAGAIRREGLARVLAEAGTQARYAMAALTW